MTTKLIVSKFGGTSMGDAACMLRSAEIVKQQNAKIVVVSATSGTTNQLIALAQAAQAGNWGNAEKAIFGMRERHQTIASELSINPTNQGILNALLDDIDSLARGIFLMRECSPRAMDRMQSYGERLSSLLFTEAMKKVVPKNTGVENFDIRQVMCTDNDYGRAAPQIELIKTRALEAWPHIRKENTIYVTQGFIGRDPQGHTTTLGRGGSDYSATLIGEAVSADVVEIWTDVAGIASTDPRIHKGARIIGTISFDEAAEMAVFGAKVLHPTTLVPAMRQNIPVFVGSSFNPEHNGTWIYKQVDNSPTFRALALKKDQALITLTTPRMLNAHGFLARAFEVFQKNRVSVDAITTSEISLSMTVDKPSLTNEALLQDLRQLGEVSVEEGFALVSLIGNNMNHTPGLAVKVFSCLQDINVRMICLGASRHNFALLVQEEQAQSAISRLHSGLLE